jgi:hypothetical protein
MADRPQKPQAGDIFELNVDAGFGHLQFVGTHAEYGDAIRVVPKVSASPEDITTALLEGAYITFYPLRTAVLQKLIRKVGHLPAPPLPQRLRRAGVRVGGRVQTWIVEEEDGETLYRQLSEQQLFLPVAAIWNHELLIQRIRDGWRPEQDGAS